ncbi:TPA: hypothetical protein DCX16_01360 [bacterium]|nr:hypothetical protein [bacterium]
MHSPKLIDVKVDYCYEVSESFFKIGFTVGDFASRPGQFVNILCNNVFLRRPFSIHSVYSEGIEILYKKVGPGTEFLSRLKNGDVVNILGPCGRGFSREEGNLIVVAGGIGIAPLFGLIEILENPKILYGAKTKDELLCIDRLKEYEPVISTDDGSYGKKGNITDFLDDFITESAYIYACGPRPMLEVVVRIAKERNVKGQVSVEGMIGCGVGACLGCAYKTREGYKRICKDGPVFHIDELL